MSKEKLTVHQLYEMFKERFNVDQIERSIELQTLYGYLANQNKRADGHFIHEPSDYIATLIKAHLGYENPKGMQYKTTKDDREYVSNEIDKELTKGITEKTDKFVKKTALTGAGFKPKK